MTEIKVDGAKLIRIFSLLNLLFKNGDQAKVFKLYSDGTKAYIEATTSVYFKGELCGCDEIFEQMVSFSDIVPFIDNDVCTLSVMPDTILIESVFSSIALKQAYGEIYRLDISEREWQPFIEVHSTVNAFARLEKLTDFRNAYKESRGIAVYKNIVYSIFPSAWFFLNVPSNGLDQMFDATTAKLLDNFLTKNSLFSMDNQHMVFKDADTVIAVPRQQVSYPDPKPYEEDAIYIGELDIKKLHESLKSAARLSKTALVDITTKPSANQLSIKVDIPGVDISKKFDYVSGFDRVMTFRLMLGFLQCAFTPFTGKVGVYYCHSKAPLLMLKSDQVKCLLSLIG